MSAGVDRPVPFPQAFAQQDPAALQSQAAALLLLRAQVRQDAAALAARARAHDRRARVQWAPARDLQAVRAPRLTGPRRRIPEDAVLAALQRRYGARLAGLPSARARATQGSAPPEAPGAAAPALPWDVATDLARRLVRSPSHLAAAQLTRACLGHPHDLPRVAAAAADFELSAAPASALRVLGDGLGSQDPLARAVAAAALARVAPDDPRLQALSGGPASTEARPPSRTTVMVHGTFAKNSAWWQPGGDFHEYLRAQVRPDIYGGDDRFRWSGGWSDGARADGADLLQSWAAQKGFEGCDLFTHSHGGSVAMLASQNGLRVGTLVMMSCPVHWDRYSPNFPIVARRVSVRVKLDLVILVDGGGQVFTDGRIEEHVLPIWFDHFASHDPAVWQEQGVAAWV